MLRGTHYDVLIKFYRISVLPIRTYESPCFKCYLFVYGAPLLLWVRCDVSRASDGRLKRNGEHVHKDLEESASACRYEINRNNDVSSKKKLPIETRRAIYITRRFKFEIAITKYVIDEKFYGKAPKSLAKPAH